MENIQYYASLKGYILNATIIKLCAQPLKDFFFFLVSRIKRFGVIANKRLLSASISER